MATAHARQQQREQASARHRPPDNANRGPTPNAADDGIMALQQMAGNAAVAALLARQVQRQPTSTTAPSAAGTSTAVAAPEADEADGPSANGGESAAPDDFDRQFLRAVEVAYRVWKLKKDGKPDNDPQIQQLLDTVPDWRREITKVPDKLVDEWLPARMMRMTRQMLDDSERVALAEKQRYAGDAGENQAYQLRQAASELVAAEDRMTEEEMAELSKAGEYGGMTPGLDYDLGPTVERHRKEYEQLKAAYGAKFPILMAPDIDMRQLASAGDYADSVSEMTSGASDKVLKNVKDSRENLDEGRINLWELAPVMNRVKEAYGIAPGSTADQIIEQERKSRARRGLIEGIVMAVIQIGLGVVAIFATGGVALVAGGALAVMSGSQAIQHIVDYRVQKAARGSDLDVARAISWSDPSAFWLAVDIVGAVLDVGAAVKAFRTMVNVAHDLEALEAAARTEGESLKSQGKLQGEVDDFVARIMKSAKAARGAEGMRAAVLTELLQASGTRAVDLMVGEEKAMGKLLRQWGDWKGLMTVLDAGTPEMKLVAENLLEYRTAVVTRLSGAVAEEGGFGAKLLGKASTKAVSDVDLQVATGRELIAAEEYMARTYGKNWEKAFRMNFYTEAGRQTKYAEVMAKLGRAGRAALQRRITLTAERLNLAKMLRHAGDDVDSIARVEGFIRGVVSDPSELANIKALAGISEADALAHRNSLLVEVDELMTKFESAPAAEQRALAEEISEKQMEANFLSKEAYIGPGATREAAFGVSLVGPEAYQSALSQLEMIEHIISESGGDVVKAAREYELFKYVNRFAQASYKAGNKSMVLDYFENLSEYIYRVAREGHAELPSKLPENWESRRVWSGEPAMPLPKANDAFLESQFDQFMEEASKALPEIKRKAMAHPGDWAPTPAKAP